MYKRDVDVLDIILNEFAKLFILIIENKINVIRDYS